MGLLCVRFFTGKRDGVALCDFSPGKGVGLLCVCFFFLGKEVGLLCFLFLLFCVCVFFTGERGEVAMCMGFF